MKYFVGHGIKGKRLKMSNFVGINMPDELVLKSFAAFKETLLRLANINISILFMHLYRFYLIHGIK